MITLLLGQFRSSLQRLWRLYLINSFSVILIILLFAYLQGARQQLNLSITAFAGELVVRFNSTVPEVGKMIKAALPTCNYVSKKIRCSVQLSQAGGDAPLLTGLIGVDFENDRVLKKYLSITEGKLPINQYEVLIPSSIAKRLNLTCGSTISISGKTAEGIYNAAYLNVCGIYNTSNLTLFNTPQIIGHLDDVREYYLPREKDIEYCLFFKDHKIPESSDSIIEMSFEKIQSGLVESIEEKKVGYFDVMNLSVQFSVFLQIIISLCLAMVLTLVAVSNFNVYSIQIRQRRPYIGTLMSFGVKPWKIALTMVIEFLMQSIVCVILGTVLSYVIVIAAGGIELHGGVIEILQVLLSGTNRIDFVITGKNIVTAASYLLLSVIAAQIPVLIQMTNSNPDSMMRKN